MIKKALCYSSVLLFALSLGGLAMFTGAKQANDLAFSEIQGIQSGDLVRIEAHSGFKHHVVLDQKFNEPTDIKIDELKDMTLNKNYLLTVSVLSKETGKATDIRFVVDRKSGLIKTSVEGLSDTDKSSLKIDGEYVDQDVPPDWSGKTTLKHVAYSAENPNSKVCLDLGGYRGSSFSFCHVITNNIAMAAIRPVTTVGLGTVAGQFSRESPELFPFDYELQNFWVRSLMLMTQEIVDAYMQQAMMIGQFFDARHQLETQRDYQMDMAKFRYDVQPSEAMCSVASMSRDLAVTQGHGTVAQSAIIERMKDRELVSGHPSTFRGDESDTATRIASFKQHNCSQVDNGNGLTNFCPSSASQVNINQDVNFMEAIDAKQTLAIDLNDPAVTDDERNIFNLTDNLVMAKPHPYIPPSLANTEKMVGPYSELRSISAMRSIVRSTVAGQLKDKIEGPNHANNATPYLHAKYGDHGLPDSEIVELVGERPSYNAQMNIINKVSLMDPNFYSSLHESPANVDRMEAVMTAKESMQDNDKHSSSRKMEMNMAMYLELLLRKEARGVNSRITASMQ